MAFHSTVAVVLLQMDKKRQGQHEIYLVQEIGREKEVFGVSLYEVKEGHCRTEENRTYSQSCVHTVTEIAVLHFSSMGFASKAQDGF